MRASSLWFRACGFKPMVKEFACETFIKQFAVHRFAFAILPAAARLNLKRLHILSCQPALQVILNKLQSIVAAQKPSSAMLGEKAKEHFLHFPGR